MSMMRCGHCQRDWDSDWQEWCSFCINRDPDDFENQHYFIKDYENCIWCGLLKEHAK